MHAYRPRPRGRRQGRDRCGRVVPGLGRGGRAVRVGEQLAEEALAGGADEHRPAEFVSIRHLGLIHQGVDDTESEAVKAWAPCHENYSFIDSPGGTRVRVDVDVFGTYESWMADTWPKALQALKALCEGTAAARAA